MKRQIRNNCFETNSSSTHAICIAKKNSNIDKNNFPSIVEFKHGEFGWEFKVYENILNKASYLYQAICDLYSCQKNNKNKQKYINQIYNILGKYGIDCNFDTKDYDEDGFDIGYIDHAFGTKNFVESVMHSEKQLLRYLFGESKVITGNDNDDEFSDYMESHNFSKYDVYYKGN